MTRLKQRTAVPSDTRTTRNTFAAHSGTSEAVFRSDGHVRSGDLAFAPLFRPTLQRLYVLNTSTYLKAAAVSRRTRALNAASGRPRNVEQILIRIQRFGASEQGLREAQLLCREAASWRREEAERNATSEEMERELAKL